MLFRSILPAGDVTCESLLSAACTAELRSEHPLGKAIVAEGLTRRLAIAEPETFEYRPGRGIRAKRNGETIRVGSAAFLRDEGCSLPSAVPHEAPTTDVLVACDRRFLGTIRITDMLRPEASAAIASLKSLSIRTVLLTGDVRNVAQAIGESIGVDEIVAELLPEEKSAYVSRLVRDGKVVAMVGEGVNDAPALMQATIGVAMGSGTDVARESADVVLLGNDLTRFVETVRIARSTKAIIMQNFIGTIAVDAAGILLAAAGLLNPLLAAFVHVTSGLTFILNSTRMLVRPQATHRASPGGSSAGS